MLVLFQCGSAIVAASQDSAPLAGHGPSAAIGTTNTPSGRRYAGERVVITAEKAGSPTLLVSTFSRNRSNEIAALSASSGFIFTSTGAQRPSSSVSTTSTSWPLLSR